MGTIIVLVACWFIVQHPALYATVKVLLLTLCVLTTYIFWKIGFLGALGEALIMIPVNFIMGIGGIIYVLLGGK